MTSTQKSIICFRIMRQTTSQITYDDHSRKVCIISTALMSTTLTAIQYTVTASPFLVHCDRCNTFSNPFWRWCHNYRLKFNFHENCLDCLMMVNAQIPATFSYYSPHTMYQLLQYIPQSPETLTDVFPTSEPIPDLEWPSGTAVICKMLPAMDGWYQI